MITIPRNRVEETSLHRFTADLSELQHEGFIDRNIREYPDRVKIPGVGNGNVFVLFTADEGAAEYKQSLGCVFLTIFND